MRLIDLNKLRKDSLFRNSFYLMLSTYVTTGLGFFFWMINTRLYQPEDVGLATTLISVMGLIISLSGLGMGVALIRFLPNSKQKNRKINSCFTIVTLFTIVVASIFVLGIQFFSPKLIFIQHNIYFGLLFVFFMVVMSLFTLSESVFIAFKRNIFVLYKNTIFSIIKLVLPFLFVFLGAYGIFLSWTLSAAIALSFIFIVLIVKFKFSMKAVIYDSILKKIFSFSFANYLSGMFNILPSFLLPIMITHYLTPQDTAYFYIALMIAGLLYIIPQSIANSYMAQVITNSSKQNKYLINSIKYIIFLLVIPIGLIILLGRPLLSLFGNEYSSQGYGPLVVLVLASIFIAVKSLYGSILILKKEIYKIILIHGIIAFTILILCLFFHNSLMGFATSYLIGQATILFLILVFK
ncbi:MAG: oligosaccharide flippase family protein [Nanoarchaeota archaeon]